MDNLRKRISSEAYERLLAANIDSLKLILTINETNLQQLTKLNLNDVKTIIQETAAIIIEPNCNIAINIPEWSRISTGCSAIDSITRGGIPVNGITEIVGSSGVGKTQLCLQLSLLTQFPNHLGGCSKGAVYISTEDTFPSKRLRQLTKAVCLRYTNCNIENIRFEDNIFLEHIADYEQLRRCLCVRLPVLLASNNVGLIVIDSIAGVFRSENADANYINRCCDFNALSLTLMELGRKYNIAIVCTNQVTDNPKTSKSEPCLGLGWSNLITCRFSLERKQATPLFNVVFAPDLPNRSCNFIIQDIGIV